MQYRVVVFYHLLFGLIFLQWPLNGSLPGNSDTIYNVFIFNDYGNRIEAFFTGEEIGHTIYPEEVNQLYAEPYLGEAASYLLGKLLGMSDIWAYWFFIVVTYATNAFGVYLLALLFTQNKWAALMAGTAFGGAAFLLSQVELLNGIPWFPALLSIWAYFKFFQSGKTKWYILTLVAGALEIYFSAYIFVYLCVLLAIITIVNLPHIWPDRKKMTTLFLWFPVFVVIITPFAYFYLFNAPIKDAWNPMDGQLIQNFNLKPGDLVRPLHHNLLYPTWEPQFDTVLRNINYGFMGIAVWVLVIIGLFSKLRYKGFWVITALVGLVFAFGPSLQIGRYQLWMPLTPLYEHTDLISFLRVPARAYGLTVVALCVLSAYGFHTLLTQIKDSRLKLALALVLSVFILIENLPTQFFLHPSEEILSPDPDYLAYLQSQPVETVVINLPSSLFSEKSGYVNGISEFSREYIYAYWQTKHKRNTINGSCGFFPESRLKNKELTMAITKGDEQALHDLLHINSAEVVVFHKNMVLIDEEHSVLELLMASSLLKRVAENEQMVIFEAAETPE